MSTLLLVILVLLLVGALPTWNLHYLGWYPSGIVTVLLVIVLVLLLTGHL